MSFKSLLEVFGLNETLSTICPPITFAHLIPCLKTLLKSKLSHEFPLEDALD